MKLPKISVNIFSIAIDFSPISKIVVVLIYLVKMRKFKFSEAIIDSSNVVM